MIPFGNHGEFMNIDLYQKIGKAIRATRKELGMSQLDLAKALGFRSQSAISKIESGQMAPSIEQLVEFCKGTNTSITQICGGYTDGLKPASLATSSETPGFRLPKRYAFNRGSIIRNTTPMIQHFEDVLGPGSFQSFALSKGVDPDFFVNRCNQIHMSFHLDMFAEMIRSGFLSTDTIHMLTVHIFQDKSPLRHVQRSRGASSVHDAMKRVLKSASYVECNFDYGIDDESKDAIYFTCQPNWHVLDLKRRYDPILQTFLCDFKKRWIHDFMVGLNNIAIKIDERECYYKGAKRCVYRISALTPAPGSCSSSEPGGPPRAGRAPAGGT